jgi:hypothetical protein
MKRDLPQAPRRRAVDCRLAVGRRKPADVGGTHNPADAHYEAAWIPSEAVRCGNSWTGFTRDAAGANLRHRTEPELEKLTFSVIMSIMYIMCA